MQLKFVTAISVLLFVVASLSVAGCSTTTSPTNKTPSATPSIQSDNKTFESGRGYTITYPTTWGEHINRTAPIVDLSLTMSPNEINVVTVASEKLNATTGTTLEAFSDYNLKSASQLSDYALLSKENKTLGGNTANKAVWQATEPQTIKGVTQSQNAQIKTMQYFLINNGWGYVVTYKTVTSDYDTYLAQAEQVINSFKFTS